MVLLTLLGLTALILRQRRKTFNDANSNQDEIETTRSRDGPEVDNWNEGITQNAGSSSTNSTEDVPQSGGTATAEDSEHVNQSGGTATAEDSEHVNQSGGTATAEDSEEVNQSVGTATAEDSEHVNQSGGTVTEEYSEDLPQSGGTSTAKGCEDIPKSVDVPQPSTQQLPTVKPIMTINSRSYEIGDQLGEGAYGKVHAATCLENGLQVAIKRVPIMFAKFTTIVGHSKQIPVEIALHFLANQGPKVDEIIQLLDWELKRNLYLMVVERPMPCKTLREYILDNIRTINEDMVRIIMHQAVFAAQTCCQRGVFHRDIKLENLLINDDLKLKLIDFGCAELLTDSAYTVFTGTRDYRPPEYLMTSKYHGKPATVWSLGIVMFTMLFKHYPKQQVLDNLREKTESITMVSKECIDFLCCCLEMLPEMRIELDKLLLHDWFKTLTNEEKKHEDVLQPKVERASLKLEEEPQPEVASTSLKPEDEPQPKVARTSLKPEEEPQPEVASTSLKPEEEPQPKVARTSLKPEEEPQPKVARTSLKPEEEPQPKVARTSLKPEEEHQPKVARTSLKPEEEPQPKVARTSLKPEEEPQPKVARTSLKREKEPQPKVVRTCCVLL